MWETSSTQENKEEPQDSNKEDKVSLLLYDFLGLNEPLEVDDINESLEVHSINEEIQKNDSSTIYNEKLFSIVTLVILSLGCIYCWCGYMQVDYRKSVFGAFFAIYLLMELFGG